jgi:hypothetical protein
LDRNNRILRGEYREHLRTAVGSSAAPYGYTLATWTTGAVLTHAYGVPATTDALLFMTGAILAFALLGVVAFGGWARGLLTRRARLHCGAVSISSRSGPRLGLPPLLVLSWTGERQVGHWVHSLLQRRTYSCSVRSSQRLTGGIPRTKAKRCLKGFAEPNPGANQAD